MNKLTIKDVDITGKKVLIRVDFNVPVDERGNILDDTRIRASLKTINYALDKRAKVILVSHLGRPKGKDPRYSLKPVAERLSRLLGKEVKFVEDCVGEKVIKAIESLSEGEVLLLENIRFHPGETKNDDELAKTLASYADVYVNDAFGTAHRKHASTYGVAKYAKIAVMGFLMQEEIEYFEKALESPARPVVAVIGGAKVSSKIGVLNSLINRVDKLIVGGAMAFTFWAALGYKTGKSLVEKFYYGTAKEIMRKTKEKDVKFYLPVDFVVAEEPSDKVPSYTKPYQEIPDNMMGLDIGRASIELFKEALSDAKTVIWNGPMGMFELERFKTGTIEIAKTIASLDALSIAGGGDTDAAIHKAGVKNRISHISTGGGAFLELLEKGTLPCVEVLNDKREA